MLHDTRIQKFKRSSGEFTFSVLIPSWNNLEYLKLCIESIRKNSHFKHQVIVHINEGSDGTREWVESQKDLDYTWSDKNIGVCYALNLGRTLLATDYIVYLNDDMYLCPGWDVSFYREIKSIGHNQFFLSSTAIEPYASSNCAIEKNYGTDVVSFREQELLNEFSDLPMHDWQGSTWPPNILHKDIWDLVGGYSVEFSPGMYSDPDFSMKLWLAGIRLFKGVSSSRAYHFGSKSTTRVSKNKGYDKFIAKWGITSSTLTKHILQRGTRYKGPIIDRQASQFLKMKNKIKRLHIVLKEI